MERCTDMAIHLVDEVGELHITCHRGDAGRIHLRVDGPEDAGLIRLKIYRDSRLVVDRLIRELPDALSFEEAAAEQYQVVALPVHRGGKRTIKSLTWRDWDLMVAKPGAY